MEGRWDKGEGRRKVCQAENAGKGFKNEPITYRNWSRGKDRLVLGGWRGMRCLHLYPHNW
jgi:hypothetical protein